MKVTAKASQTVTVDNVPPGTIVMWSNSKTIPEGWHICDGSTQHGIPLPNLTDRFVLGASTKTLGTQGGSTQTSITIPLDSLPAHSHSVTDPGHKHLGNNTDVGTQGGSHGDDHSVWQPGHTPGGHLPPTQKNTTNISIQSTGKGQAFSQQLPLPPYYALYYIIKLPASS